MSHITLDAAPFVRPPQVAALAAESFTQKELAEAFEVKETAIIDAVSRFDMFLISKAGTPRAPRRFHYLDALALLVYLSFAKEAPAAAKKTLVKEVSALLFGDQVAPGEADERRAAVASERERSASAQAKSNKFLYRSHLQRREEIRRDFWSASVLWWARDANRRFVLFGRENHEIVVGLFDRRTDGGKVDMAALAAMKIGTWVNATEWFCRADGQLAAVVARRRVEA